MMLVHGPISDRYGRRATIIGALSLFCAGSLGCALAQSIEAFLGWRALQGLAVGATTVVGRALIRDLFEGPAAQRQFAQVNLVFTLAPVLAPIVAGDGCTGETDVAAIDRRCDKSHPTRPQTQIRRICVDDGGQLLRLFRLCARSTDFRSRPPGT
jgi:hypothetical protein